MLNTVSGFKHGNDLLYLYLFSGNVTTKNGGSVCPIYRRRRSSGSFFWRFFDFILFIDRLAFGLVLNSRRRSYVEIRSDKLQKGNLVWDEPFEKGVSFDYGREKV